jgi:alpha-L-fucosidase 2
MILFAVVVLATLATAEEQTLWYSQPAKAWMTEALPIGNGVMGGMIFGGTTRERLQFNEDSLWTGDENPSGNNDTMGVYQAFGDVFINLPAHDKTAVYRRELNIGQAVARVSYQNGDVNYLREYFCSNPDRVLVARLTADKPGAYAGSIELTDMHKAAITSEGNRLTASGSLRNGLRYESQVLVLNEGGTLKADANKIEFNDCNALTILLVAGTDYAADYSKKYRGEDPHSRLTKQIQTATTKTYADLKSAHVKDYQRLFNRVELNLGQSSPAQQAIPTDQRLKAYKGGGQDMGLEQLFFQYARYLLISCSRPGGLPANLQGLWIHLKKRDRGGEGISNRFPPRTRLDGPHFAQYFRGDGVEMEQSRQRLVLSAPVGTLRLWLRQGIPEEFRVSDFEGSLRILGGPFEGAA